MQRFEFSFFSSILQQKMDISVIFDTCFNEAFCPIRLFIFDCHSQGRVVKFKQNSMWEVGFHSPLGCWDLVNNLYDLTKLGRYTRWGDFIIIIY